MSTVSYDYADGVARLTLADRDRGNAINMAVSPGLLASLRQVRTDRARVGVLGATGRFFSVGGDLAGMAAAEHLANHIDDLADSLHRVVSEIQRAEALSSVPSRDMLPALASRSSRQRTLSLPPRKPGSASATAGSDSVWTAAQACWSTPSDCTVSSAWHCLAVP